MNQKWRTRYENIEIECECRKEVGLQIGHANSVYFAVEKRNKNKFNAGPVGN